MSLAAKAGRAAEWCNANDPLLTIEQVMNGWGVYFKSGGKFAVFGCDRLLVAFCEDRGWQDQEQEANGVEWEANQEFANVGKYLLWVLSNSATADAFYWSVNDHNARLGSGTAPTREEARRQAVEAARGMNNEERS